MDLSPTKRACALGLTALTLVAGLGLSATPAFAAPGSSFGTAASSVDTDDVGINAIQLKETYNIGQGAMDATITRDGKYVFTANNVDRSVSRLTVATGVVKTFPMPFGPSNVVSGADGYVYVSGFQDNGLFKMDPESGMSSKLPNHDFTSFQRTMSADGKTLYSILSNSSRVYISDLEAGTTRFVDIPVTATYSVDPSLDGSKLYLTTWTRGDAAARLMVWDLKTNTPINSVSSTAGGKLTSPDESTVYFSDTSGGGNVSAYDVASGEVRSLLNVTTLNSLRFEQGRISPDGRFLYVPDNYNFIIIDLEDNTSQVLTGTSAQGTAVSADGTTVYAAGYNGRLFEYNQTEASADSPVDVTSPVDGSTVSTSNPVFSGTGQPDSDIVITDADGRELATTTVDASGNWSIASSAALLDGAQMVTVTQTSPSGKTTTDSTSFTIDTATPVPFDVTVAGNVVSGKGVDGATIDVVDKDGKNVGTTTVAGGVWSITVAPFGTGKHPVNVTQTVGGVVSTPVAAEIDFGAAAPLIIEKPLDGSTVVAPDNLVPFSGTGQPGASVVITNGVGRKVVDTTVGADGKWAQTGFLGHQFYELDTSYMPKGEATVLGKTTVTVKASAGVVQPFSVSAPVENSTVVAPDNMVTFAGKGTTGAHIVIKNQVGRAVVDTIVDDLGNWSAKGFLGFQWYELDTFSTVNGATEIGKLHVTVKASAGVTQPFSLDTPADNATVIAPNNLVTFSGKGTTGATVSFKAQNGREIFSTKVDEKGNWTAAGGLGFQWYELNTSYTAPGAAPVAGKTHLTVSSGKVINAFEMTAPKDGDTVVTPNGQVSFTGKGAAGATVKIINDLGGQWERIVATAVVKDDGTWTATGGLNPNLTYPLWFAHTPGSAGGVQADGAFTITTSQQ